MRQRLVNLCEYGFCVETERKSVSKIRSMSNEPLTIFSLLGSSLFLRKDTNYTDHRLSTVTEQAIGTIMENRFVLVSFLKRLTSARL